MEVAVRGSDPWRAPDLTLTWRPATRTLTVTFLSSNSIKVNESAMNKPAQLELVGRKIRQLRRQRKLTQVELAEKIGIHQSDLSRMEQGEYKVGLDTLLKILQTFDLSIGDFFDETSRPQSVAEKLKALSPAAQKEVENFIDFKRRQEMEVWTDEGGESGGEDA
jgi:transcriptional regulator with XRE-family HTH domain